MSIQSGITAKDGWKKLRPEFRLQFVRSIPTLLRQQDNVSDVHAMTFLYRMSDWMLMEATKANEEQVCQEINEKIFKGKGVLTCLDELGKKSDYKDPAPQRVIYRELLVAYYNHYRQGRVSLEELKGDMHLERIFGGYLRIGKTAGDTANEDPEMTREIQQLIHLVTPNIAGKGDTEKLAFVKNMMRNLFQIDGEWEFAKDGFPGFIATINNQNHVLDLAAGRHVIDGQEVRPLPDSLGWDPLIESKFKFLGAEGVVYCKYEIKKIDDKEIQVYSPTKFPDYQLMIGSEGDVIVLRRQQDEKGKEHWCQYVKKTENPRTGEQINPIFLSENEEQDAGNKLLENKVNLAEELSKIPGLAFLNQVILYLDQAKKEKKEKEREEIGGLSTRAYIKSGVGNKECWLSIADPGKVLVADIGEPCFAVLSMKNPEGKGKQQKIGTKNIREIDAWTLVDENIRLLDTSKDKKAFKRFAPMDIPERILAYGRKGEVSLLEFPHLRQSTTGEVLRYRVRGDRVELGGLPVSDWSKMEWQENPILQTRIPSAFSL